MSGTKSVTFRPQFEPKLRLFVASFWPPKILASIWTEFRKWLQFVKPFYVPMVDLIKLPVLKTKPQKYFDILSFCFRLVWQNFEMTPLSFGSLNQSLPNDSPDTNEELVNYEIFQLENLTSLSSLNWPKHLSINRIPSLVIPKSSLSKLQ